jgi:hypothetical protein
LPVLRDLHQRFGKQGLVLIGVSIDEDPDKARRAARQHDADWRQVCDGAAGPLCQAFEVNGIPDSLLFGRDGRLRADGLRGLPLVERVEQLLAEPEPAAGEPPDSGAVPRSR